MKLRKLHIENYKIFKDFNISFVDKEDKPLPIIVLAGVNGSGKTTLLEFIKDFETLGYFDINGQYLNVEYKGTIQKVISANNSTNLSVYEYNFFSKNVVYFQSGIDKIENIKETIREKYIDRAFEIDKPSKALEELQDYIKDIFNGLDLTFNLSTINYNKKEVLFKDNNGVEFDIDELSTGEKTLLSKVLYLFFKDYKDKVILIDEPELSLHPSWQNKVLKIYENFALKNNCQVIIATHSPHIIGSAKNEYLRFLIKEDNKIVVKQLSDSPLNRDTNTILKTLMGANYKPKELEDLQLKYRELFDEGRIETEEAKEIEKKILQYESINSAFFQGIAFDKALME